MTETKKYLRESGIEMRRYFDSVLKEKGFTLRPNLFQVPKSKGECEDFANWLSKIVKEIKNNHYEQ
jgi:hypothetical protein